MSFHRDMLDGINAFVAINNTLKDNPYDQYYRYKIETDKDYQIWKAKQKGGMKGPWTVNQPPAAAPQAVQTGAVNMPGGGTPITTPGGSQFPGGAPAPPEQYTGTGGLYNRGGVARRFQRGGVTDVESPDTDDPGYVDRGIRTAPFELTPNLNRAQDWRERDRQMREFLPTNPEQDIEDRRKRRFLAPSQRRNPVLTFQEGGSAPTPLLPRQPGDEGYTGEGLSMEELMRIRQMSEQMEARRAQQAQPLQVAQAQASTDADTRTRTTPTGAEGADEDVMRGVIQSPSGLAPKVPEEATSGYGRWQTEARRRYEESQKRIAANPPTLERAMGQTEPYQTGLRSDYERTQQIQAKEREIADLMPSFVTPTTPSQRAETEQRIGQLRNEIDQLRNQPPSPQPSQPPTLGATATGQGPMSTTGGSAAPLPPPPAGMRVTPQPSPRAIQVDQPQPLPAPGIRPQAMTAREMAPPPPAAPPPRPAAPPPVIDQGGATGPPTNLIPNAAGQGGGEQAVNVAPPRPGGLEDPRRTAAYDPTADVADRANLGAVRPGGAVDPQRMAAIDRARQTYNQALSGAYDFARFMSRAGENHPHSEPGRLATMSGVGAASVPATAGIVAAWDMGGTLPAWDAMTRYMMNTYVYLVENGQSAAANQMAFEIVQRMQLEAAKFGTSAMAKLRAGDYAGALKDTQYGHAFSPDGMHMDVSKDGQKVAMRDQFTGEVRSVMDVNAASLLKLALGLSDGTAMWTYLKDRAGITRGRGQGDPYKQQQFENARKRGVILDQIAERNRRRLGGGIGRRVATTASGPGSATQQFEERYNRPTEDKGPMKTSSVRQGSTERDEDYGEREVMQDERED